jgi:glycosyltransferase involved in cell wall biosynthesis
VSVSGVVSVAIPTRDAGPGFEAVLRAVRLQVLDAEVDLVVVDSGSGDGTADLARRHGARVEEIAPHEFSHGGTRNRLMELARGDRVAFLTQDAEPAGPGWLAALLRGLDAEPGIGLAYGPYRPRPGAAVSVAHDLDAWFGSLAPDGAIRVDRATAGVPTRSTHPANFFTSANACVARWSWERVPFRAVPYAEDRLLASETLEAGIAKAYVPDAPVLHSHDYTPREQFRRAFDEARALRAVYGQREPLRPDRMAREIGRGVRGDLAAGATARGALGFHLMRTAGRGLGSRAERLPGPARRALSLEARR